MAPIRQLVAKIDVDPLNPRTEHPDPMPEKQSPKHCATRGERVAARIRKETNGLSEAKREELFKRGMQLIYGGGTDRKTARVR